MVTKIGLLEYGCGNIRSVQNALVRIGGGDVRIVHSEADLERVEKLIFPGVGAFDPACRSLEETALFRPLQSYIQNRNHKVLGICLGMQLLCAGSREGVKKGLGVVDARVENFKPDMGIKIPHMGWNTVTFVREDPLLQGLGKEADFYFVHSYHAVTEDKSLDLGITDYGGAFTSIFRHANVWGVQFHPEKSQSTGLKLLSNFLYHA